MGIISVTVIEFDSCYYFPAWTASKKQEETSQRVVQEPTALSLNPKAK